MASRLMGFTALNPSYVLHSFQSGEGWARHACAGLAAFVVSPDGAALERIAKRNPPSAQRCGGVRLRLNPPTMLDTSSPKKTPRGPKLTPPPPPTPPPPAPPSSPPSPPPRPPPPGQP